MSNTIESINTTCLQSLEPLFTKHDCFEDLKYCLEVCKDAWDTMNSLSQEITTELDEERLAEIQEEFETAKADWESNCFILSSEDEATQTAIINHLEQAIEEVLSTD
jgi:hypothetical protein